MAPPPIHLSIVINKGSPLDYPQYRHTALWLRFLDDGDPSPANRLVAHIIGPPGEYIFEARESSSDPSLDPAFAKMVDVGVLKTELSAAQIVEVLRGLPVRNLDREFNCQTWVEGALRGLRDWGFVGGKEFEEGVDGMVSAMFEAEDVEV